VLGLKAQTIFSQSYHLGPRSHSERTMGADTENSGHPSIPARSLRVETG
jgi:hypothetical protein